MKVIKNYPTWLKGGIIGLILSLYPLYVYSKESINLSIFQKLNDKFYILPYSFLALLVAFLLILFGIVIGYLADKKSKMFIIILVIISLWVIPFITLLVGLYIDTDFLKPLGYLIAITNWISIGLFLLITSGIILFIRYIKKKADKI